MSASDSMHLTLVVGTVLVVNVAAALLVALLVFVSAQDFLQVLPKIIDSISYLLSRRQRFEVYLARRRHLEEQIVIEMINQTALAPGLARAGATSAKMALESTGGTTRTLTAAEALRALNMTPPQSPWQAQSNVYLSESLDRAVREFCRKAKGQSILWRIPAFVRANSLVISMIASAAIGIAHLVPYVRQLVWATAIDVARQGWQRSVGSITIHVAAGVVAAVSVLVSTHRRLLVAAVTTWIPLAVLWSEHASGSPLWGALLATAAASLRVLYGYLALRRVQRPVRASVLPAPTRFLVHGNEYFAALSEALQTAQHRVFISGWWLAPDLHLRDGRHEDTLIALLREVKTRNPSLELYFILYNEPLFAPMRVGSAFVMQRLQAREIGAKVLRLPARLTAGSLSNTLWSNHRKIVVVDPGTERVTAFVGGIDLCFGRYDTAEHEVFDYQRPYKFQGLDYWCPHEAPMSDDAINDAGTDIVDRRLVLRLPWHDVQAQVSGPLAQDIAMSFAQMWNSCNLSTTLFGWPELLVPRVDFSRVLPVPPSARVLQSLPTWGSSGPMHKHEIMNAYIRAIERAQHYVYIETQFFVTWCGWQWGARLVENPIGLALVRRLWQAVQRDIRAGTPGHPAPPSFFLCVVLPLLPEGQLEDDSVRAVMHFQYMSTCRGRESVLGQLQLYLHHYEHKYGPSGVQIKQYVRFFALQRVAVDPLEHWPQPAAVSPNPLPFAPAVRYAELRVYHRLTRAQSLPPPGSAAFAAAAAAAAAGRAGVGGGGGVTPALADSDAGSAPEGAVPASVSTQSPSDTESEASSALVMEDRSVAGAGGAAGTGRGTGLVGGGSTAQTRRFCRVAVSSIYVHSKLMIVDDNRVIIGSANLNDRSMLGNRDAEIAIELADIPQIKELRQRLWAEFTGVHPDDPCLASPMEAFRFMVGRAKDNERKINAIHPGTPSNPRLTTMAAYREVLNNASREVLVGRVDPPIGYIVPYPPHFLEGERLWHQSSMTEQFSAFVPPYAYT